VGEQDNTAGEWVLTPETLDLFVRALVSHVDYDIHKGYECGEEDGEDRYPELVTEAAGMLDAITGSGPEEPEDDAPCAATFREEPMPDIVYCGERGYHQRHTSGGGSQYYAWLDDDEGAGWNR
jgi:hypothetical protein